MPLDGLEDLEVLDFLSCLESRAVLGSQEGQYLQKYQLFHLHLCFLENPHHQLVHLFLSHLENQTPQVVPWVLDYQKFQESGLDLLLNLGDQMFLGAPELH